MKKIFLALIALSTHAASVKAQLQERNFFLGTTLGAATYNFGNFSYDYSTGNLQKQDEKKYAIQLNPEAGVFLSDHLVFGGDLGLGYGHNHAVVSNATGDNVSSSHTTNSTSFTVGPFVRYYFFNFNPPDFAFYIQANAGAGTGESSTFITYYNLQNTTFANATSNHEFIVDGGVSFGFTYFIQRNIGLDIGLSYSYDVTKYNNSSTSQTTTNGTAGAGINSSYKATEPTNGIGISAGFHLMVL